MTNTVGFWIEKRGDNYYGFCDNACKPILNRNRFALESLMSRHCLTHDERYQDQLSLFAPAPDDDGTIPF